MAKTVQLKSKTTLNGVEYEEGTILSVSESIFGTLSLPEYIAPVASPKKDR